MGVDLDTLRPQPSVEGYTTPGGYSYRAVKPIALAKVLNGQGGGAPGGYSYRAVKPIALAKVAKGQGIDLYFI